MKQLSAIAGSLFMGTAVAIAGCGTESPTQPTMPSAPVRSIQQLLDAASSGDTIVVPPGVYHEHVRIDRTEQSNITLKGYGVILDGSGLPIPRDGIDIFSLTGVGIYVRTSGPSQPPTGVVIEGFVVENFDVGIWAWGDRNQLRNVETRNNTRGFRNIGIWVGLGATVVDSVVHDNGSHGIMTQHRTTVHRTICTNNGVDDQNGAGILVRGSDDQILDNEVLGNPWGIYISGGAAVVRRNRVHGNARAGIVLAGSGCGGHLIEDNDATFNGVRNVPPTFDFDLFDEAPQQRCHPDVYRNVWRNNRGKRNFL
jgi:hypothetical protein